MYCQIGYLHLCVNNCETLLCVLTPQKGTNEIIPRGVSSLLGLLCGALFSSGGQGKKCTLCKCHMLLACVFAKKYNNLENQ